MRIWATGPFRPVYGGEINSQGELSSLFSFFFLLKREEISLRFEQVNLPTGLFYPKYFWANFNGTPYEPERKEQQM